MGRLTGVRRLLGLNKMGEWRGGFNLFLLTLEKERSIKTTAFYGIFAFFIIFFRGRRF